MATVAPRKASELGGAVTDKRCALLGKADRSRGCEFSQLGVPYTSISSISSSSCFACRVGVGAERRDGYQEVDGNVWPWRPGAAPHPGHCAGAEWGSKLPGLAKSLGVEPLPPRRDASGARADSRSAEIGAAVGQVPS